MQRFNLVLAIAALLATPAGAVAAAASAAPPRTDNAVIHVQVSGKGRPVILIPGLTCSGEVWNDAVAHYQERFECHVVTLGGFAGQPRYEGPFLDTARDALLAYIRDHKLKSPVVVGHSLGGVLAMQLAIAAPGDIGPLVIVDALPFLGGAGRPGATAETARAAMTPFRDMLRSQTQEQYAAFQANAPYLKEMVTSPADLARVTDWGVRSDHLAVADAMFEVGTVDLRPQLDRIQTPVLVLGTWYGMRQYTTRAATDSTFRLQFSALPRATVALADSARHFVMLDAPEWTWTQIDRFLAAAGGTAKR
jgi:pimeloyl-ACP methyl ester carboxylesterase